MPSLSLRENYLKTLMHEENEFVPMGFGGDVAACGLFNPANNGDPAKGIPDGFGVTWVSSDSAMGGLIPRPGEFILKDVTRWKKEITIPNHKDYPWEKLAEEGLAAYGPALDTLARGFFASCGPWERLAALMGFEEAMIAMYEEPEAVEELLTAITDDKIRTAEIAARYFKADTFTNFDDIATERQLFISPDLYRALIKPQHTRLCAAVKNLGMIPIQHTCGHAELCVEDYIETGAECWNTVQTSNDVAGLLDKYGDKFCFDGGLDMNGKPSQPDSTVEDVVAEVERCFREYGGKKGYMFSGMVVAAVGDEAANAKNAAINETAQRLRFAGK
jgi:hypothetical protein